MRKNGRKIRKGYTFLEIFLSLSILGIFLGLISYFPTKRLNQAHFRQQKQDCLIGLYEKISPFIQKALAIRLTKEGLKLQLSDAEKRYIRILDDKHKHKEDILDGFISGLVSVEWFYWDNVSQAWLALEIDHDYTNVRFLKLILRGKRNKIMEAFVFSCCGMIDL